MLATLAANIRREAGIPDEDLAIDHDLATLGDVVGLDVRRLGSPDQISLLARGRLHISTALPPEIARVVLAYAISRVSLFGPSDCEVIRHGLAEHDQERERAWLLSAYLLFGPNCGLPFARGESGDVAALAGVPVWYVLSVSRMAQVAEAHRELWKDPDLGRRVRRLAAKKGLVIA